MQDHAEPPPALTRGFRIVPFEVGAQGFIVKEWYTRGETVELVLITGFFLIVGLLGTLAMLSLLSGARNFPGVSLIGLMMTPWLLIAVWASSRIFTRRLVLFHLDPTWTLETRRTVGRFVLRRNVLPLSAFGEVYLTSSHGTKTGWSHTVGCRRGKCEMNLTRSSDRREAIAFAIWLGQQLGLPVVDLPEELPPRSSAADAPRPVVRTISDMQNPRHTDTELPGGEARK